MKRFLLYIVFGSLLLSSRAQDSMNVNLLYHWEDTSLVSSWIIDNVYNEVWGFVQGGKEYAVIGTTAGTHIFDVTDPVNSYQAVFIPGAVQSAEIIHRDYHDYNGYLYAVSDEGFSTLQIADLSYLPDSAPLVFDSDTFFRRSHNIFIDTATAKLYTCGGTNNNGMRVFSLADPENPVELVNFNMPYTHDVFVRNDTAYHNCGNSGLFVYDFSVTATPQLIGSLTTYPDQGYNHSGWLNASGNLYAMADETHGMDVKMLDVSDLGNIQVLDLFDAGNDPFDIAHNPIILGDRLFIAYYYDGLVIFDISDPNNVMISGYYDTSVLPHSTNYEGAWGVYPFLPSGNVVVSDMQNGLYILDVSGAVNKVAGEKAEDNIVIFPNPFKNRINISVPGLMADQMTLELFDYTGKSVLSKKLEKCFTGISVEAGLPAGFYIATLSGNGRTVTKKLIKID